MKEREKLASRLGFIFLSAGCAIGLGNVWRFPYITGQYGGAAFVLIYILFLLLLSGPIMVMEFAVGRGSGKSVAKSFHVLEPVGTKWHIFSYFAMAGNYLLIMFYSTISGWVIAYLYKMLRGEFTGKSSEEIAQIFADLTVDPVQCVFWMIVIVSIGCAVCALGLQNGVEKITKVMMSALLAVMLILAIRSVTLSGGGEGIKFYLIPDFHRMREAGIVNAIYAAMGQAFFTLSVGMGGMAIFGSYIGKEHSLTGESVNVVILDTFVALTAGFIIFPACFSYGVDAGAGPGLIFITLPNIFKDMPGGQIWGALFFVFMSFAALSTIIGVFENIMAFGIDLFGLTRKKAVAINFVALIVLSIPAAIGGSVLAWFQPFGPGSAVLDLEDFLVSNCIMPLGALLYLFFCTRNIGWGWKNFLAEANTGKGLRFPAALYPFVAYVLPVIVLVIFVFGIVQKFA